MTDLNAILSNTTNQHVTQPANTPERATALGRIVAYATTLMHLRGIEHEAQHHQVEHPITLTGGN